jgi:hypothetical protein
MKVYQKITQLNECIKYCNPSFKKQFKDELETIMHNDMPYGSGIDNGISIDEKSTKDKLILIIPFHCMDSNGYCGWKEFKAIVKPSLQWDIDVHMIGRDYNGIKDYLYEIIEYSLTREYTS